MKLSKLFLVTITSVLFLLATVVVSCDNDEPVITVTGVTLNKNKVTKTVGETEQLTATVAPADASNTNVTWTSSNDAIATVDANGKVTALSAGTTDIVVTTQDGNKTAVCVVTVKSPYTIKIGEEEEVEITNAFAVYHGKSEGESAYYIDFYLVTGTANVFDKKGTGYVLVFEIYSNKEYLSPGTYTYDDENYDPFRYNEASSLKVFKNGSFVEPDEKPISSEGKVIVTASSKTHYELSFDLIASDIIQSSNKVRITGKYVGDIKIKNK